MLLAACRGSESARISTPDDSVRERMQKDIEFLASPDMGGRPAGSEYEKMASSYLKASLKQAGLKPKGLPFRVEREGEAALDCENIFAFLDHKADSTILISAHYDHLGLGSGKSLEIRGEGIHPGADDNASGVAILLELARAMAREKKGKYNVAFVAFSAHEIGRYGVQDFLKNPLLNQQKWKLCLNLDMVGRLNERSNTLKLSVCQQFPGLFRLENLGTEAGLKIRPDLEGEVENDYSILCEAGLPAISLTTGIHDDYHRRGDTPAKINYAGMEKILGYCRLIMGF